MSYVNPIWLEGRRKYWTRHDAHLFAPPDLSRNKSYAARMVEQRQAEEEATRIAAEQEALHESLLWLRRELAEVKFELAFRGIFHKYRTDQPRVPKGDPDGGQWIRDAGRGGSLDSKPAAMRRGPSDKRRLLPLHAPVGKPAASDAPRERITIINNAQTGMSRVDETTEKLRTTLEGVVNKLPDGSGARYGTKVHTDFANAVRDQNLSGIGRSGVEQTFPRDQRYGSPDSVRTDVTLRDDSGEPIAIYDVKTGGATLAPSRVRELLRKSESSSAIPVIEMHVIRGLSLKARAHGLGERWIIIVRLWKPGLPDIADPLEGEAPF